MRCAICIWMCVFSTLGFSQSITLSSGKNISDFSGSLSYSIGEVFYQSKGRISEGVQQNFVINPIATTSSLKLAIYPNPTSDLIYIKVENYHYAGLAYDMYDLAGKLVQKGQILSESTSISLRNLTQQIYILHCFRDSGEDIVFKIIKTN